MPPRKSRVIVRSGRRDADWERMQAFKDAMGDGKEAHFDRRYGNRQLQLLILGTHPNYRRQRAATQLCRWGLQLAQEHEVPITVLASPIGQKLYSHLGFRAVGAVIVQVEGEEERLSITAMIRDPAGQIARLNS